MIEITKPTYPSSFSPGHFGLGFFDAVVASNLSTALLFFQSVFPFIFFIFIRAVVVWQRHSQCLAWLA